MAARKPLEEHLAEFLLTQGGPAFKDYRRRCLAFWKERYGDVTAAKVEKIVKERYRKK